MAMKMAEPGEGARPSVGSGVWIRPRRSGRYRVVRRDEFLEDTDEILALVGGDEKHVPGFLARPENGSTGSVGAGATRSD